MTSSKSLLWIFIIAAFFVDGCSTQQSVTRRSQLRSPLELGPITVLTNDTTLFELTSYLPTDSTLVSSGFRIKGGEREQFSGSIDFRKISYIQARKTGFFQYVGMGIAVGAFVVTAANSFGGSDALRVTPTEAIHSPATGGGESCPFIYSWSGDRYVLEAEAFATALGKSLEYTSSSMLPSLRERNSEFDIRITNERAETHYINSVSLTAFECEPGASVYLDAQNTAWPTYALQAPDRAVDHSNRNVLSQVVRRDETYWESDLSRTSPDSDLNDVLEFEFAKTSRSYEGTLVLHGINTQLSSMVFKHLFGFLGDQFLNFMYAVENDPELVNILRRWIDESSLKAFVWDEGRWQHIGRIQPEANAVPFSRVLRFKMKKPEESVRIRIEMLTDVWRIDAALVDWSKVSPLSGTSVPLVSAKDSDGRNVIEMLTSSDQDYLMLLPPQHVDLRFRAQESLGGKKIVYALNTRGYLYEWMAEQPKSGTLLSSVIPAGMKIPYLKKLLADKHLFLPPIYTDWKFTKR